MTVSNSKRTKCSCEIKEYGFEREDSKKKKFKPVEKRSRICGEDIVETHDIPEELIFSQVWDSRVMFAFLQGQRIDESFVRAIQKEIFEINKKLEVLTAPTVLSKE